MTAPARAASRRTASAPAEKSRPSLWVLPRPAQGRPLAPFVVLMLVLLVLGLVSLLLLNTWSSQDAFRLHTLQSQQSTLDDDEQALSQQVQNATDPITLATRAQALGLAAAGPPVFVKEVKPGQYVIVGTKKTVKGGVRMGSLLVIPAKTPPKPPAATTPPAAVVSAAAPASAAPPVTTTSTAPAVATTTAPVVNPPASAAVKAVTKAATTTVTKTALTPSTGAVHG